MSYNCAQPRDRHATRTALRPPAMPERQICPTGDLIRKVTAVEGADDYDALRSFISTMT